MPPIIIRFYVLISVIFESALPKVLTVVNFTVPAAFQTKNLKVLNM